MLLVLTGKLLAGPRGAMEEEGRRGGGWGWMPQSSTEQVIYRAQHGAGGKGKAVRARAGDQGVDDIIVGRGHLQRSGTCQV